MRRKSKHTNAIILEINNLPDGAAIGIKELMEVYLKIEDWNFDATLSDLGIGEYNYQYFYKKVYGIMAHLMDAEFRVKFKKYKIGSNILFGKNPDYIPYVRK